ncbi:MAG: CRTAC1 family protein, partial [Bacteroidota bacterium]
MKRFVQLITAGIALLFLGTGTLLAQEVSFSTGPTIAPALSAANGGFSWGDLLNNGNLDVFTPSTSVMINNITSFVPAVSTMTQNITLQPNGVGALLADFNGDGVLDLFTTNGGTPASGLYYNTAGVFTLATGTGDLATAGVTGEVFQGLAAAPIDHSNYLSVAWPGNFAGLSGNNPVPVPAGGIWLLKGGPSGFTDIGRGATGANVGIDTSRSFESWDVRFLDANNDGYMDLLMPSFRNGFSRTDTGTYGTARKGCVLFMNDGTGKFYVPTSATLPGNPTIYAVDSVKLNKAGTADSIEYASAHADTGIIVDDTVRHFAAIGETWGDLNNDGNEDLILNGLNANDNRDGNDTLRGDIILYGNGDGTFTYKWDGVHVVANSGLVQDTHQRAIDVGDYNNDGWPDIYTSVTNGGSHLYKNNGNGTFTEETTTDGVAGNNSRAGAFVDYNNDGFLDIFQFTAGSAWMQKNSANNGNHWIAFTPVGTGHNMSAIGAKFTVYTAAQLTGVTKQVRVIKAEGGSAGMGGSLRANFGLGAATSFDSVVVNWPDGTRQSWSYSQLSTSTAYSVLGKYWTIVEGSSVPTVPVSLRPTRALGDTALGNSDTLTWNASTAGTGAITYEAQVATAGTFSSIFKDITGLTSTSSVVRLGLSTQYYWRVRASQAGFTGGWSAVDTFHTLIAVDSVIPIQRYPANTQLGLPLKPTLLCGYVYSASTYHFQLDTLNKYATRDSGAAAFKQPAALVLNDSTDAFDTLLTVGPLKPNYWYYWRVRGWNSAGSSKFSPVDSFQVMFVPATPVLAYPAQNGLNLSTSFTFKWSRVVPAGQTTPGDSNYVVQFWTYSSTGTQLLTSDTTKHDSSLAVSGLQNLARYYWKVMTFNQGGSSAFTAVDSFTTATQVPGSPNTVSPKAATNVNRITQYIWNSVPNSTSYHIQVSSASDFSAIVYDNSVVDTSVVASDTLQGPNVRYYWHVSAVNAGGEGGFSGAATFTTSALT